ncbi:28S ribosomal protein S24 [Danaus plexippus plexippus]|uniref:28S ribosomal protein S24 n=1 Tax=Danaus plexippus plexippus TaxID=278856 RepID=A0A212END4_DANPL|nr:28S ribosomal protein S24 [Danaus plexippus plexippus]
MNNVIKFAQSAIILPQWSPIFASQFHTSSALCRVVSGKYRITKKRDKPLTYEMANPPHYIAHRKTWNSWNTCKIFTIFSMSLELLFAIPIIKTYSQLKKHVRFVTVIIKRQFNHIRVAVIIRRAVSPTKMYFLLGYSEEMLSNWIQCPVTLELQTVDSYQDVVFKYI